MMSSRQPLVFAAATLLVAALPCSAQQAPAPERLSAAAGPPAHAATRLLVARSVKLNKLAWLEAETIYEPGRGMRYRVLREGGDAGMRKRVLRKVLDSEVEMSTPAVAARSALTDANYTMNADAPGAVRLVPRRREPSLINGVATFDERGRLRRIEGRLSKSPSFWVRSVDVTRSYEPVGGLSLPVLVESVADVKFAGSCEFSMWIDYTVVNGQRVAQATAHREPPARVAAPLLVALQHAQYGQ